MAETRLGSPAVQCTPSSLGFGRVVVVRQGRPEAFARLRQEFVMYMYMSEGMGKGALKEMNTWRVSTMQRYRSSV